MDDEHQMLAPTDFTMVANALTQGIRDLPTDYVARVRNFLAEYLGNSRHPVPFGGREKDFEHLNLWLADAQASPYLLLAAPAGRGKSALLLRWCQRLLARRDLAVAYFPVSIRFRTNLASVAFPTLVALLAQLHGEKVPADPNMHEEVWRGLFVDYINRPLSDGRSLLLVLDGVDEAADWSAGSGLFPLEPPSGLRIVLSARYLANDRDADAWLHHLDWTRPGLARTMELYPLDRTGIANVLTQMGFPLDLLGTRVNIVSELYRLSEGDPLLVRLYVDDLWERGEQAVRFQPEDLRAIRPGLAGYFERWWKDQRLLWSETAPQREAAAQTVLNLLAGALGPLSKADILSLVPEAADFESKDIDQHMTSLARFVTGDGIHQGYVFSHPRLGNYFLEERLSPEERQQVEQSFLSWGERTLAALNEGIVAPEDASPYIVQYYGAHLERARADAPVLLRLVSDGWRRAWEKLDRANAGFLGDVERAWRAAERTDGDATQTAGHAPYLGEEIRSLLSQVSVNSVTSNISPRLMLEAVKTRVWTPAQGLASIRLITDLAPRARELVGLAPYVQEPLRTDILQEALDTVMAMKNEYDRLDTLIELASRFSVELLWQIMENIPTIEDEADRAGVLAELAPALAPYQSLLERALDFVQEIQEEEYRALALEGLAPHSFVEQHGRVLQLVRAIQEERYRAQSLSPLIPYLSEGLLQEVLHETLAMQDGLVRIRLLTELVTSLPEQLKAETVQEVLALEREIEDREYRIEVLVRLAPFLPEERLRQALQEIQLHWDENYRTRALCNLLPYLPQKLLPEVQQTLLTMKSEEARTTALLQLIPLLPQDLLEQALESVETTWDEGRRAELLAQFALYAHDALLSRLLEIIETIQDQGYHAWLLAELESPLAGKISSEYFNMPAVFHYIPEREERLQTLLAITPRLSEGALAKIFDFLLPEVFNFTWRMYGEEQRAHILTKLGSHLPAEWLPIAFEAVSTMREEVYQAQTLIALAPRIGEAHLSEVLDIIRGMRDREKRAQVLEVLVSSLPEERKAERVQEMLQVLQVIKDETERAHLVASYASFLPAMLSSVRARVIINALQMMRDETNQARVLKALASHIPVDLFENVLEIVQALQSDEERTQLLDVLAPHVPEKSFSHFLECVQALQNERWRAQILATLVANGPKSMLTHLLEIVQSLQDETPRSELLSALGQSAPEDSFSQLWTAAMTISNEGRRIVVLGVLALRMPESFFAQFWDTVMQIPDEGWQMWVLRALAPNLVEQQFARVWDTLPATRHKKHRLGILLGRARCVPERAFSQIWDMMPTLSDEKERWQMLEALVSRVPQDYFLQFLRAVQAIPLKEVSAPLLDKLLPRVPQQHFAQVWEIVQTIQNPRRQAMMLMHLASSVPDAFLPQAWQMMQTIKTVPLQMQVLKALIPSLPQERLTEALQIVQMLRSGELQAELLEVLIPYLSEEICVEMLNTLRETGEVSAEALPHVAWERRWSLRKMAMLVAHLSDERSRALVPAFLEEIQNVKPEEDRAWLLTKLSTRIPEELLQSMLEFTWSLNTEHYRLQVLEAILRPLSQESWEKIVDRTTKKTHESGDVSFTLQLLKVATPLVQQSSPALLYPVLREVLHLLAQYTRRDTLIDLVPLAPALQKVGREEAITEVCSATLEVGCWWP